MRGTIGPGWRGTSLSPPSRAPEALGAWLCPDPAGAVPGGLGAAIRDTCGFCVPGTLPCGPECWAEGGAGRRGGGRAFLEAGQ